MKVRDLMSTPVVTVSPGTRLSDAARAMLTQGIGSLVVVDAKGQAVGILTERDFTARSPDDPFLKNRAPHLFGRNVRLESMQEVYAEARRLKADEVMRGIPWTLRPDDPVERAVDIMDRHGLLHLVVLDETRQPVGLLSRHDLLRLAVAAPEKPVVVAGP